MNRFRVVALVSLVALVLCTSCSEKAKLNKSIAESLMDDSIFFEYAIYYLPVPSQDPMDALRQRLGNEEQMPGLVSEMQESPSEPLVCAFFINNVSSEYAPPDLDSLRYFGRGLSREQAEALQNCEAALILDFGHPKERVWEALSGATRLVESIARDTGGLLWDEETREVFTPDEWHKRRIESWEGRVPDISDHTTIHAYKADEFVRAITLGMAKFGLPDVVVEEFSWSMNRNVGHLINLLCQAMAEGVSFKLPGEYDLDIRTIENENVRNLQLESLGSNATAVARLTLREGTWEEGDPRNRLVEIAFDRYPGLDDHAKQEALLASLFGYDDEIVAVKHDEELLAASEKAKEQLPNLQKVFSEGLEPGEYIQVKAPFKTSDGGNEWMWVEVVAWEGSNIKGLLKNEPYFVPSLHAGQIVDVKQEDVFDYMRHHPDGTEEGNETGVIIGRMQRKNGEE